jgi:hypothetical protein
VEPLGACRSLPQRCQLSLNKRQVNFHIELFEACSTFTRVTARTLAESLDDPFHRRLQPGRCLPDCSDCYRPERPLPEGTCTLSRTVPFHGTRLFRALLGVPGFKPPSSVNSSTNLIPASGDQDHTALPSASGALRLARDTSIASRATSRDDRDTPSCRARDDATLHVIRSSEKEKYF